MLGLKNYAARGSNTRRVVSRSEFSGTVSITTFTDGDVSVNVSTSNSSSSSSSSTATSTTPSSDSFLTQELLTRSAKDAYLTGTFVDREEAMIYYTTQLGIYAYNLTSKGDILQCVWASSILAVLFLFYFRFDTCIYAITLYTSRLS